MQRRHAFLDAPSEAVRSGLASGLWGGVASLDRLRQRSGTFAVLPSC